MRKIVLLLSISLSISVFSQDEDKTLMTIDGEKISVSEFKRVYEKNLDLIDSQDAKDITKNLELFISFKLKVREAYEMQLDTLPSYKKEIETYKDELSLPYLQDTTFIDQLVKDAYFRTKYEVNAKHILIRTSRFDSPKDTLETYTKILKLRERIINGEEFEDIANEYSQEPSAQSDPKTGKKGNGGNLGYFSAFKMVYPFEVAAYSTKIGEISMPFKTSYGYHIVQVTDIRKSKGEIEVANIFIKDTSENGKVKIDSVYTKLQNNEKFEDLVQRYSDHLSSKKKGGKLDKFGSGEMIKPFSDAAFALENINDYSKPLQTKFGWHIVKLLKKYPIASFEELKKDLKKKVMNSARMQMSTKAVLDQLKKEYVIIEHVDAKKILDRKDIRRIPLDSLQSSIISINNKNISQEEFINYIKNNIDLPVFRLFEKFKEKQIIDYYKENLIHTKPEYVSILKEYEEGLLLFELMQEKIWKKSSIDSLELKKYFNTNSAIYDKDDLKNNRGQVINDYQNFLENNWLADLRKKYKVQVNKRELNKIINFYREK
jgi:peptidyl-prolyl cis-trans isomerase SurA